jgi:hypothetical protein
LGKSKPLDSDEAKARLHPFAIPPLQSKSTDFDCWITFFDVNRITNKFECLSLSCLPAGRRYASSATEIDRFQLGKSKPLDSDEAKARLHPFAIPPLQSKSTDFDWGDLTWAILPKYDLIFNPTNRKPSLSLHILDPLLLLCLLR